MMFCSLFYDEQYLKKKKTVVANKLPLEALVLLSEGLSSCPDPLITALP